MLDVSGIDTEIFLYIQSFTGNRFIDSFFLMCAEFLVFLIPVTLVYLWFGPRERRKDSIFTFVATVAGISLTYFLGLFYFHHQPFSMYETVVSGGELDNAFPSQHTASMFSVFWSFLYLRRKKLASLFGFTGLLTGFGRVFVGYHYPIDIVGAILSGFLGLLVSVAVFRVAEDHVDRLVGFSYRCEDFLKRYIKNI